MWGQRVRCTSSTAAFAGAFTGDTFAGGTFAGMDATERAAKFLHHGVKRGLERGAPPNQDVVVTGGQRRSRSQPNELAQAPAHPVALHGIANLLADGEANPRQAFRCPCAGLQDEGAGMSARALLRPLPCSLGHGPKVTPAF
jgi:hypothetical protein